MSRRTSYAIQVHKNGEYKEVTMTESVTGRGVTMNDALQSLLDNIGVRADLIREELRIKRGERL